MPIDTALVGALHIEYLKKQDLKAEGDHPHHTLFQTSTIDALLEGNYDGDISFAQLADRGDFGLGTLNALDGEMIGLDGRFYQVKANGRAYPIGKRMRTPFAVVTVFEPGLSQTLNMPMDLVGLCGYIDQLVSERATCCAVRVDGFFERIKTRSVPRQHKPYPPLAEVVKSQPTFELRDVQGSLVGFRFPNYAQGMNVAGYHFHFITSDRSTGGHVLELRLAHGKLYVDREPDLWLELPPDVDLPTLDPTAAKRSMLDRIERE
jgi:acetolactate decarboxylase